MNLAGNFAAATDFGSDGPGSATYSLVLTGSNVASGLFALDAADTTAGDGTASAGRADRSQPGRQHDHRFGGPDQLLHDHAEPGERRRDVHAAAQHLARQHRQRRRHRNADAGEANLLTLVQTVTDADGDVDTAAINLGTGVFQIEDDGPDAVVANAVAAAIVLDETRPVGTETDGDSDPAGLATATVNLAGNFAAVTDFGSDGPGSATYSLVLTGSNVASGLFALDAADTTAGDGTALARARRSFSTRPATRSPVRWA